MKRLSSRGEEASPCALAGEAIASLYASGCFKRLSPAEDEKEHSIEMILPFVKLLLP